MYKRSTNSRLMVHTDDREGEERCYEVLRKPKQKVLMKIESGQMCHMIRHNFVTVLHSTRVLMFTASYISHEIHSK